MRRLDPTPRPGGAPAAPAALLLLLLLIGVPFVSGATPEEGEDDAPALSLRTFTLAKEVEDREPIDPTDSFSRSEDQRIVAFLEVANPARTATTVTVHWARQDGADRFPPTSIDIPAYRRWRTWAYTTPRRLSVGEHLCIVKAADGRELGRKAFEVVD